MRHELATSIERLELRPETPDGRAFHGSARFGASLVGPPGWLHGGLHAYARVFPVLDAIASHDPRTTFPCRVALGLGKPLVLEESIPFDGRYAHDERGFVLEVRHADSDRLKTRVTTDTTTCAKLERFRALHADYLAHRDEAPEVKVRDVAVRGRPEVIVIEAGVDVRRGTPTLAALLDRDGSADAALGCVLLDIAAAVVLGWELDSRCYTVRMELVLERSRIPANVDVVALGDRAMTPDTSVPIEPVDVRGRLVGPMAIDVLLADAALETVFAHGTITLVPKRGA